MSLSAITAKLVLIGLEKSAAVFLCQPLQHAPLRKCRQRAAPEPEQDLVFFAAATIDEHEAVVKTIIIRHLVLPMRAPRLDANRARWKLS